MARNLRKAVMVNPEDNPDGDGDEGKGKASGNHVDAVAEGGPILGQQEPNPQIPIKKRRRDRSKERDPTATNQAPRERGKKHRKKRRNRVVV